ncbi:MAG: hypothetical protein WC994_07140 [Brumimicrobium sp.]
MGKIIYGILLLGLIGVGTIGCEKDKIQNPELINDNMILTSNDDQELKIIRPSYGEIACFIRNSEGDVFWGKRCGTPKGKCGKKETACEAIRVVAEQRLPEGMKADEFIKVWNNDESRVILEKQGYYSQDVKE